MYINICFLIDHPFDLILFLGLKNILKKNNESINIIAILTSHKYFKKCDDCNTLLKEFDQVIKIKKPSFSMNFIKHICLSILFIKAIYRLNKLENIQYLSANRSELTTQLVSRYCKGNLIRILQRSSININSKTFSNEYRVDIRKKYLRNIFELLLNLPFSKAYVNTKTKYIKYIYYKNENTAYDLFLVNNNLNPNTNEIHFPYFFNDKNNNTSNNSKKVYFFGSRFLQWDFLENKYAIKTINSILRKIESIYPDNTEFIYKPHPMESNDSTFLELNKFKIIEEINSAEINFLKYNKDILGVYSIGSTSSKTAFNFGLNSYVTYKIFNFDKKIERVFDKIFEGLEKEFFIDDISNMHVDNIKLISINSIKINNLIRKIDNE